MELLRAVICRREVWTHLKLEVIVEDAVQSSNVVNDSMPNGRAASTASPVAHRQRVCDYPTTTSLV